MADTFSEVIKLRFGTVVVASDGEAGAVDHVTIQPGQRMATALGVKIGRGPGGVRVEVPLDRVTTATSAEVRLTNTREALLQAMARTPAAATTLSGATRVTLNGKGGGALTQVSVNRATRALRRLAYRPGLGGELLGDVAWITDIADDGRTVAFTLPAGQTPVPYRPDADLFDAAHAALYNYPRLRIDLRAIEIHAVDGEVWLRGHVSSKLNQRIAAELLENLSGLTTIHNELVADPDLAITVARALTTDPRTHGQLIGVYPILGKVILRGRALTPEAAAAAAQIAAAAAGQGEIVNQIAVDANAHFLPVLAPVTGADDIIPGGD